MTAFAQLKSIDDPRDRLDKAYRHELARFAAAQGVAEIVPNMPAILMRDILRRRGLTNINIPPRPLGQPQGNNSVVPGVQSNVPMTDAAADLAKQWEAQQKQEVVGPEKPKRKHEFNDIRAECKKLGIKFSRRDNLKTLKAKLADHGENTP